MTADVSHIFENARVAARKLNLVDTETIDKILLAVADEAEKEVDYILVPHTNGRYENAADEMDSLLGIKRTILRSFSCKTGKYKEIK